MLPACPEFPVLSEEEIARAKKVEDQAKAKVQMAMKRAKAAAGTDGTGGEVKEEL